MPSNGRTIKWIVFDVGETLLDETRQWEALADRLGVPRFTFFDTLGALIAQRRHHREVFKILAPDFDYLADVAAPRGPSAATAWTAGDLYPDARPALAALKAAGYKLGIVGNQPAWIEPVIASWEVAADLIASSASWGIEKPDVRFYKRLAKEAGAAPERIAYVGDRIDNDIVPARAAGLHTIFIRRGPWGFVHADWPEAALASARIESLGELPALLTRL